MTRLLYPHDSAGRHLLCRGGRGAGRQGQGRRRSSPSRSRTVSPRSTRRMHVPVPELSDGLPDRGARAACEATPFFQAGARPHGGGALQQQDPLAATSATRAARGRTAATCSAASRTRAGRCSPMPRPARRRSWVEGGNEHGDDLRSQRRRRGGDRRLRRRRRHARQRAGAEGHQGGAARGRQAAEHRHLHQRRVGELRPALLARQAHHLGHLAGRAATSRPAGLDLQDRRRHHHPLGRRLAAPPGARVQGQDAPMATSRAPTCWTGRSRWPSSSPTTPRPRTRWG